jgi:hypothetical protein
METLTYILQNEIAQKFERLINDLEYYNYDFRECEGYCKIIIYQCTEQQKNELNNLYNLTAI